jgi:hypothetical protein
VRAPAAAGLALATIALAGCGDGEESAPPTEVPATDARRLTPAERDLVEDSEEAIVAYCRRAALALTRPGKRPTVDQQARALEAVDELIALAAEKPAARTEPGGDVRLFVGDLAENLQGSNCDPIIVARLDAGLATLPQP